MFSTKLKLTGTYSHCTEVVHDHDIIVLFLCMQHTGLKYFRVCQAANVSEIITTEFSKLYIHAGMHACYFVLTCNTYNIITLTCSRYRQCSQLLDIKGELRNLVSENRRNTTNEL